MLIYQKWPTLKTNIVVRRGQSAGFFGFRIWHPFVSRGCLTSGFVPPVRDRWLMDVGTFP